MLGLIRGISPEFRDARGMCFEPCGFSCNAHSGLRYLTCHVTPEPGVSFASLEISSVSENELAGVIAEAVSRFQPGRISVNIFGESEIGTWKFKLPGFVLKSSAAAQLQQARGKTAVAFNFIRETPNL